MLQCLVPGTEYRYSILNTFRITKTQLTFGNDHQRTVHVRVDERRIYIAFDRCQWQWCEITSGFESNPILASSLNGTPWPLHRKLLFSLLEGYCHGELLDSISWRTINSGNCWCLQIPRAECFHSLAYTNGNLAARRARRRKFHLDRTKFRRKGERLVEGTLR